MKVIIAGTRTFSDYAFMMERMDYFLQNAQHPIEVVSGTAPGADRMGERYARERGYDITLFAPDWDQHGSAAGPIRNEYMAAYATHAVIFWDGVSRGSFSMINLAKQYGLKLRVVKYKA